MRVGEVEVEGRHALSILLAVLLSARMTRGSKVGCERDVEALLGIIDDDKVNDRAVERVGDKPGIRPVLALLLAVLLLPGMPHAPVEDG